MHRRRSPVERLLYMQTAAEDEHFDNSSHAGLTRARWIRTIGSEGTRKDKVLSMCNGRRERLREIRAQFFFFSLSLSFNVIVIYSFLYVRVWMLLFLYVCTFKWNIYMLYLLYIYCIYCNHMKYMFIILCTVYMYEISHIFIRNICFKIHTLSSTNMDAIKDKNKFSHKKKKRINGDVSCRIKFLIRRFSRKKGVRSFSSNKESSLTRNAIIYCLKLNQTHI